DGEAERGRITARLRAGVIELGPALAELLVGRAERVDLRRVARRQRGDPSLDGSPEDERRMWLLHRPRERLLIPEPVRGPVVVEATLGPGANDDLDLLGE